MLQGEQQGSRDTVFPPPTKHTTRGSWEAAGRHARHNRARDISLRLRLGYSAHVRGDRLLRMPNARSFISASLLQAGFSVLQGLCSVNCFRQPGRRDTHRALARLGCRPAWSCARCLNLVGPACVRVMTRELNVAC